METVKVAQFVIGLYGSAVGHLANDEKEKIKFALEGVVFKVCSGDTFDLSTSQGFSLVRLAGIEAPSPAAQDGSSVTNANLMARHRDHEPSAMEGRAPARPASSQSVTQASPELRPPSPSSPFMESSNFLQQTAEGKPVTVKVLGTESNRWLLAIVDQAGQNLNTLVVRNGWANLATNEFEWLPFKAVVQLQQAERQARHNAVGIWQHHKE